ncbi:HNH endonuclease [Paenibacillus gorillae]|uniref:HNH endonuclease n=1 Tax=Paenibacillus gorillae TaxID=1243662 RepID=UPI0004B792E5|nr:HNH endonuclease [Paenibacillus gorillae]
MADTEQPTLKYCAHCHEPKPMNEFLRRTGRRSGAQSRRGACRSCRKTRRAVATPGAAEGKAADKAASIQAVPAGSASPATAAIAGLSPGKAAAAKRKRTKAAASTGEAVSAAEDKGAAAEDRALLSSDTGKAVSASSVADPKRRPRTRQSTRQTKQRQQPKPSNHSPTDTAFLRPTQQGTIWMRGKTDKGRRWYQEIDIELAVTLVKERAAVVVNRHTIRRLFSNKDFRKHILTRDNYTCYFCGDYGDTIDHMLPRAKGGHTTPDNCVCACNFCNQSKADKDLEEFMKEN